MEARSYIDNRITLRRLLRNGYKHRRKHALPQCYCEVDKGQARADVMMRQIIGRTNYKAVSLLDLKSSFNADLFETVLLHIKEIND